MYALHEPSRGAVLDIFNHRYQLDVGALENGFDRHMVFHIPRQPVDLVNNNGADIFSLFDTGKHQLKAWAVSAPGGFAPVGVLINKLPALFLNELHTGFTLGSDRVAFALIGLGLFLG
ncbi:MAG: hypothetical protein HZB44_08460 [Actinobacteria bacterium]|nr:hypothetical protein [Actinomycetota bacterium]